MNSFILKLSGDFPVSVIEFSSDVEPLDYLNDFKKRHSSVNADNCLAFCGDLVACFKWMTSKKPVDQWDKDWLLVAFQLLDLITIINGPNANIMVIVKLLEVRLSAVAETEAYPEVFDTPLPSDQKCPPTKLVICYHPLYIYHAKGPFLIQELASEWPAVEKWKSPSFWIKLAGHRSFPVEIGRSYLDPDWRPEIILLKDYMDRYVFSESKEIAYIAQHNWIHQLHILLEDVCLEHFPVPASQLMLHFWFGMSGTLTPLHFDKYNNFFTQIVGYKRITLVDPAYSAKLPTNESGNTCTLTEDQLNAVLSTIPHETIIIKPGEILFIRKNWWHRVESLSFSISLSFWF